MLIAVCNNLPLSLTLSPHTFVSVDIFTSVAIAPGAIPSLPYHHILSSRQVAICWLLPTCFLVKGEVVVEWKIRGFWGTKPVENWGYILNGYMCIYVSLELVILAILMSNVDIVFHYL